MYLEITSIKLLSNSHGQDTILLKTTLPNGTYPYTGVATLELRVASQTGEEYIKENLDHISSTYEKIDV